MNRLRFVPILAIVLLPALAFAEEAEWGHLTGCFLYDGDPPPTKTLPITKNAAEFDDTIVDESLEVSKNNGGIANIVVYLLPKKDNELSVHPSYACEANTKVELAMQNGRFVPHVLLMRTSQ